MQDLFRIFNVDFLSTILVAHEPLGWEDGRLFNRSSRPVFSPLSLGFFSFGPRTPHPGPLPLGEREEEEESTGQDQDFRKVMKKAMSAARPTMTAVMIPTILMMA